MTIVENLFLNGIFLFLPLSIYLVYLMYIKNLELKEKKIIIEFALYTSLILMLRYDKAPSIYSITIYSIPLLIALHKKYIRLYALLAITLIWFVSTTNILPTLIITEKCLVYLLIYLLLNKFEKTKLHSYIFIEILIILMLQYNTLHQNIIPTIITIIVFVFYVLVLTTYLKKTNQVIELSKVLKELEHEKLLRSSISKLTHELKNPIAVCQGYLEMMDFHNPKKLERYLSIITNEINRSKTIIDEFSNYGKLKKLDLEEMDIVFLFEDILELLNPLFKNKKATITINEIDEMYILGDYNKLKQVLINILKNTLEATKEEELLKVEIILKQTKNKIIIKVIDNGIGMNKETLSRVSEVFFTTKSNGTGLGIAYSKEVIELHKGSLKIKSEINKGTEITITLPKEKKSEDFNNKNY